MRHYLICSMLLLGACGQPNERLVRLAPQVPADLLTPCPGWQGARPKTEGQLVRALVAEVAGRQCANAKVEAMGAILTGQK